MEPSTTFYTTILASTSSARWVPKLLSQEQKQARVETSMAFNKMVQMKGLEVLGRIVTMDESSVSFHNPHPYH